MTSHTSSRALPPEDEQPVGLISVLMSTRNRPADAKTAVRSLLASSAREIEIIVVDQSDDTQTEQCLRELGDDRIRYIRSETRGLAAGLDEGLRLARSPYVVHTDDDCEAPPAWVGGMAQLLADKSDVAVVFSNVIAGPHDSKAGFVPVHIRTQDCYIRSVVGTRGRPGMGAAMAMRRDVVLQIGGFDRSMGAGGRFYSMDDWDVELRVLLAGWNVFHTSRLYLIHHGFRTHAQARAHRGEAGEAFGRRYAQRHPLCRSGHRADG
jgi:GT2 family glycosyltransferase